MTPTEVQPLTGKLEIRLKRNEFNEKFRFREARKEGLVNCVSCIHMSGGVKSNEVALCQNPNRTRAIKLAKYHEGWGEHGYNTNISSLRMCDAHTPKPLPDGMILPIIPDKHAVLLGTQRRDPYHADSKCPYVLEELRMMNTGGRTKQGRAGEVYLVDLSEKVLGETIRDICEMPCCEGKLPFQIPSRSEYRICVGIKPDGTEPIKWVRNGIVKHGSNVSMTLAEAESFFDLSEIVSEHRDIYAKIIVVSEYLDKGCNLLGSRPLAEAVNPVKFSSRHHFWEESIPSPYPEQFWAYDERLFDKNTNLSSPILELETIPEGFLLCLDNKRVLRNGMFACRREDSLGGRFRAYGIIKPMEDKSLLSKGVNYFMDIMEVNYSNSEHMWGEFGIGFSGLKSFDEE